MAVGICSAFRSGGGRREDFGVQYLQPDCATEDTESTEKSNRRVQIVTVNWTEQQQTSHVSSNLFFSVSSVYCGGELSALTPAALAAKNRPTFLGKRYVA